jgi:hypothetical protein
MTKQELIAQLEGPATVEFTFMPVSKVIELLNELEETSSVPSLSDEDIRDLASAITESLESEGLDLISDYDLSMSYREVELDSVTLDSNQIEKEVKNALKDFFTSKAEESLTM